MSHPSDAPDAPATPEERGRIVAAAQRLRARQGARFTAAQLARAAGLSRATLYRRLAADRSLATALGRVKGASGEGTRDELRAAAIELLTEKGLAALTMDAVAARAGLSTATLYRHFESREALLRDVVRGVRGPTPTREVLAAEGPLDELLERFVECALARLRENPHLLPLLVLARPEELRAMRALRKQEEGLSSALLEFFRRDDVKRRLGDAAPEELLASLMGQVLGALVLRRITGHAPAPDARSVVKMFLEGALRRGRAESAESP